MPSEKADFPPTWLKTSFCVTCMLTLLGIPFALAMGTSISWAGLVLLYPAWKVLYSMLGVDSNRIQHVEIGPLRLSMKSQHQMTDDREV